MEEASQFITSLAKGALFEMMGLSLKWKISLVVTIVILLISVAIGALLNYTAKNALDKELEEKGFVLANILASEISASPEGDLKEKANQLLGSSPEDITYVLVSDQGGQIIAHTFKVSPPPELVTGHKVPLVLGPEKRYDTQLFKLQMGGKDIPVLDLAIPMVKNGKALIRIGLNQTATLKRIFSLRSLTIYIVVVVTILGALITLIITGGFVTNPLNRLIKFAEELSWGNIDQEIEVKGNNEISYLAEILNRTVIRLRKGIQTKDERETLRQNITGLLEVINSAATGDLTKEAEVTTDVLGIVADSLNLMIRELTDLVNKVRDTTAQVIAVSDKITISTEQASKDADLQARQLINVDQAVEEMIGTIGQVVKKVSTSAQAAQEMAEVAKRGRETVGKTIQEMGHIRASVASISSKIEGLRESTAEIGEVVGLIDDIADQTDLLALNAAIRFSRAGEYEEGFAIVTDQVKELAERATKSTGDVAELIKDIQTEMNRVLVYIKERMAEVEQGVELADETDSAFQEITRVMQKSSELIETTSQLVERGARDSEEIRNSMKDISRIASQVAARAKDTASASAQLSTTSQYLRESINTFKISEKKGKEILEEAITEEALEEHKEQPIDLELQDLKLEDLEEEN